MRVRDWQDILADVIERDVDPAEWRAVAGDRHGGIGEDLYLGHPNAGVYHLKTYAKNPFEVRGVGTRVARRLDDEIGSFLPDGDANGRFGVRTVPEDEEQAEDAVTRAQTVLEAHRDAPTGPVDLFEDLMDALESPAFGPMTYEQRDRPEALTELADQFDDAEDVLNASLDDLIETDEVDRGFM